MTNVEQGRVQMMTDPERSRNATAHKVVLCRVTWWPIAICLFMMEGCAPSASPASRSREAVPQTASTVVSVRPDYAGVDSCAECHAARVDEFRLSRHYLACVEAARVPMPVGFEPGRNVYASRIDGLTFEMSKADGNYFMTAVRQSPDGEQRHALRIDLVYGHGAATDEAYFSWTDGRVYELPMVWMHPQQCWASAPINPFAGGAYARPLTVQCLHCHNTWIEQTPGSTSGFVRESAVLGVTCERCHGPAAGHVNYHRQHPGDREPHDIARPALLSRERQLDLCAQCHDNAIQFKRPPFSYRPGDVLDEFIQTPQYRFPEDNHVANQNGGMQASRCFQHSRMTCMTCHSPHCHRSADELLAQSCTQCHQPVACGERGRLPAAVQNRCIDCHMPEFNKVQVNFRTEQDGYVPPVKRREHRIAVDLTARDTVLWDWARTRQDDEGRALSERLSRSLAAHWRQRGDELRSEYRFLMAIDAYREALRFESSEAVREQLQQTVELQTELDDQWFLATQQIEERQTNRAIATLESILEKNPRMARAHGRLGTLYAAAGDAVRGVRHLNTAAELDPNDSYGPGMLGWLAYLDARLDEALGHQQRANRLEPRNPKLQYQLGLTLAALKRWPEAEAALRNVLEWNPDSLEACVALARGFKDQTRYPDAADWARRAVELSKSQDAELLLLWSDCSALAGRYDDARRAAELALGLADSNTSAIARRARDRLKLLQRH